MYVRFSNILYTLSAFKIHINTLGILVRNYFHKFCFNNGYLTTAKTSLRNAKFYRSEIAIVNAKN